MMDACDDLDVVETLEVDEVLSPGQKSDTEEQESVSVFFDICGTAWFQ